LDEALAVSLHPLTPCDPTRPRVLSSGRAAITRHTRSCRSCMGLFWKQTSSLAYSPPQLVDLKRPCSCRQQRSFWTDGNISPGILLADLKLRIHFNVTLSYDTVMRLFRASTCPSYSPQLPVHQLISRLWCFACLSQNNGDYSIAEIYVAPGIDADCRVFSK
jgi:hypothetical protein